MLQWLKVVFCAFLKVSFFKGFAYGRFSLQSTILKWLQDAWVVRSSCECPMCAYILSNNLSCGHIKPQDMKLIFSRGVKDTCLTEAEFSHLLHVAYTLHSFKNVKTSIS